MIGPGNGRTAGSISCQTVIALGYHETRSALASLPVCTVQRTDMCLRIMIIIESWAWLTPIDRSGRNFVMSTAIEQLPSKETRTQTQKEKKKKERKKKRTMKILQKFSKGHKKKLKSETAQRIANGREADWQITNPAAWSLVPGRVPAGCSAMHDPPCKVQSLYLLSVITNNQLYQAWHIVLLYYTSRA